VIFHIQTIVDSFFSMKGDLKWHSLLIIADHYQQIAGECLSIISIFGTNVVENVLVLFKASGDI